MLLHRAGADAEGVGDFDVGGALEEEGEDFVLPPAQVALGGRRVALKTLPSAGDVGGENFEEESGAFAEIGSQSKCPGAEREVLRVWSRVWR